MGAPKRDGFFPKTIALSFLFFLLYPCLRTIPKCIAENLTAISFIGKRYIKMVEFERCLFQISENLKVNICFSDCFYKLNHLHFALLDYQQADELEANDSTLNDSVSRRLSVVYNQLGLAEYSDRKYYRAEDYFSLAISHNCRNPLFYLSRARSRYMQEVNKN